MPKAAFQVGLCYMNAWGVERDLENAKEYLKRAKEGGIEQANTELENLKNSQGEVEPLPLPVQKEKENPNCSIM